MEGEGGRLVDWRVKGWGWWIRGSRWEDSGLEGQGGSMVDWRVKVGVWWIGEER